MPYTPFQRTNFGTSTVAGGSGGNGTPLNPSDTTLHLPTGDGAKFPATAPFMLWLGTTELAKCTLRSTDDLTLLRAQEGTTAGAWPVNTTVQLAETAATLGQIDSALKNALTGVYNVRDYGAVGDGVTDDHSAFQSAVNAANTAGGGVVYAPAATYLIGAVITWYNYIELRGDGPNVTILKAKNSLNDDIIRTLNFNSLTGTNSGGVSGVGEFTISNLTLDGNNANNTSGSGLKVYGYGYRLRDMVVKNTAGDGIYSEWATNSDLSPFNDDLIAHFQSVKVINCKGHGINWAGPHDSLFDEVVIYNSGNNDGHANLYVQNNANMNGGGLSISNSHSSGNNASYGLKTESNVFLVNNQWEGSQTAMILFTGTDSSHTSQNSLINGDMIYNAGAVSAPVGIEIGSTSPSVAPNMLNIRALIVNCTTAALKFTNDGGFNRFDIVSFQSSGTTVSGTANANTLVSMQKFGTGTPQTQVAAHLLASGNAPTLGALQTNVATQTISGKDTRGSVTITTGASGPGTGAAVAIVSFSASYASAPIVVLTASSGVFGFSAVSGSGFTINNTGAALSGGGATYVINYHVIG